MLLKRICLPYIAAFISSGWFRRLKFFCYKLIAYISLRPRTLDIFLKVNDPYCYLLIQVLEQLQEAYQITYRFYIVLELSDDMFPEKELWMEHALKDAAYLADFYQLRYSPSDISNTYYQNTSEHTLKASFALLKAVEEKSTLRQLVDIFHRYWFDEPFEDNDNHSFDLAQLKQQLRRNEKYLEKKGHYLAATLYYCGEWFWGIDRLYHLEKRLKPNGNDFVAKRIERAIKPQASESPESWNNQITKMNDCSPDSLQTSRITQNNGERYLFNKHWLSNTEFNPPFKSQDKLVLYLSARSPYSYLALEQCIRLSAKYHLDLIVKPVMPMLMRGMPVPHQKKMYIFFDTKREADRLDIPYGFVADPLGKGVERIYSLFSYAQSQNKEVEFLKSFFFYANSQAIYVDTDKGLKQVLKKAELNWNQAAKYLDNNHWNQWCNTHLSELMEKGLWGVPCICYKDLQVWGQDRLWVIERKILSLAAVKSSSAP